MSQSVERRKMKPTWQSIREHPRRSQVVMAFYAQSPKKVQVMLGNVVFIVEGHLSFWKVCDMVGIWSIQDKLTCWLMAGWLEILETKMWELAVGSNSLQWVPDSHLFCFPSTVSRNSLCLMLRPPGCLFSKSKTVQRGNKPLLLCFHQVFWTVSRGTNYPV